MKPVGVLALQGDFARHMDSLKRLRCPRKLIRWPEDLETCAGLILPGGESTTFVNLLGKTGLKKAICDFAEKSPVMGTCAGLIILAGEIVNDNMETLGLIDIRVERNAYGRQVDSFTDTVHVPMFEDKPVFEGVFIRAPRIHAYGGDVMSLGRHGQDVVMARNRRILVCTFHPELTSDTRVHRYFVEEMAGKTDS
ncbi:pyridoxal 5'-phosphate synthase glutaminase subunit PdxT [bacterium]|nr:pyridoxal 5'-phosphate synthase glutaminase subunit PdxT [bacterium]